MRFKSELTRQALAVAVYWVAVALCTGCGATRTNVQTVTVTTSESATVAPRPARHDATRVSFRLPSGNITCQMSRVVACRVLSAGKRIFILTPDGAAHVSAVGVRTLTSSAVLGY